jgi:imidazolonepropionase-like amidohydrolase
MTSRPGALLAVVLLASCSSASEADLVITGATLIDGSGGAPREGTTIVVRDGRILMVAPDGAVTPSRRADIIDASGKHVIPGLADMHFHFSLGAPLPRRTDETAAVLGRALYYGVTTVLQVGGTDASAQRIRELRAHRAAGTLDAPYIYGTGGHLTLHGTHPIYTIFPPAVREAADAIAATTPLDEPVHLYSLGIGLSFVRTEEAARKAVRERVEGGVHAIKITVESGPTPFGDDHPQMSVAMIRAIVDEATRHGLRVFAHVSSLDELEAAFEGGGAGAVHAVRNDPLPDTSLADQLVATGFVLVPTLILYAEPEDFDDPFLQATVSDQELAALADSAFFDRTRPRWECCAAFDDLLANIGMLHGRGVLVSVGTDTGNPYVFSGFSVHRELELLVRAGLTPMEAIQAATKRAAEMIGEDDDFGTIEPEKRADLLILGANPLEDIRNTRSLEVVISEGRVIDRDKLLRHAR